MAGKSNLFKTDIAFKKLATGKVHTRPDFTEYNEGQNTFTQLGSNTVFGETVPTTGLPTDYGNSDANKIVQFVSFSIEQLPGTDFDANSFEDSADSVVDSTNNVGIHAFFIKLLPDYVTKTNDASVTHDRVGEDAFIASGIITSSIRTQLVPSSLGNSFQLSLKKADGTAVSLASDEQDLYIDFATGIILRQDVPSSANTPTQGTGYLYVGKFADEVSSFTLSGSGVLSSSEQIAGDISGAIDDATGSLLLNNNLLSSSFQIAGNISGAIDAATGSILNDYGLLSSSIQIADDISGSFLLNTTDTLTGNLTVTGKLLANEVVTNIVSQSITLATGSNIFGDEITDTHQLTGSLLLTGSLVADLSADTSNERTPLVIDGDGNVTIANADFITTGDVTITAASVSGAIDAATGSLLNDYGLLSSSIQIAGDISGAIDAATGSFLLNTTDTFEGILTLSGSLNVTGNGNITASGNISASGNITAHSASFTGPVKISLATEGTALEITEEDEDQKGRLLFEYDDGNPTLTIASRASTAKLHIRQDSGTNGLYFDEDGQIYVNNSTQDGVKIDGTSFSSIGTNANALDLGKTNRPWKDLYLTGDGANIFFQDNTTSPELTLKYPVNSNRLILSASDGHPTASFEVQGNISASGMLFTSLSLEDASVASQTVMYNTASGKFFFTGSYGGGGGGSTFTGFDLTGDTGTGQTITNGNTVDIAGGTNINTVAGSTDTVTVNLNDSIFLTGDGLFSSGSSLLWGASTLDATSGFRRDSGRAYTHVTPQFVKTKYAVVGALVRQKNILAQFPSNYLVYGPSGIFVNGGRDPDTDGPVRPDVAGGKDDVGIPVVQVVGDLEVRPTQSLEGGGSTPGIRIAAGDPSGSVDPGIFFYSRDNISNDSSSFFYSSASAEIRFDTGSNAIKFLAGSTTEDLKEVLHISKSGDNPRIGIGTNNPIKAFDFKEIRDDNRGGELLIRGSRTAIKGAENNDEVGRINFAIDSASFGKIDTSGSAAEIVAIVDEVDATGVEGSLSLRVAGSSKVDAPIQRIKLIGNPSSPAVEITGSTEFDGDVTVGDDLTVNDNLTVNDYALINGLRVGSTDTDPGAGRLITEDYGSFTGGVNIGSFEDPGTSNLIVKGTTTTKGNVQLSGSYINLPTLTTQATVETANTVLILDDGVVKQAAQAGMPYTRIAEGVIPTDSKLLMFTGSDGTKEVNMATGITYNSSLGWSFQNAGSIYSLFADDLFAGSVTATSITASGNISSSGTITAATLDAAAVSDTLAAAIVAEIDNDEIPIAKLAQDAITIGGAGAITLGNSATVANILKGSTVLSSSAQIASDISGSFIAASASFSTRVAANDAKLTANTSNVTSAGALMDSELAEIATVKALTAAGISGSWQGQGFISASQVTENVGGGIVSGAAQINSLINDTIAATIVAEIDNDEIPIAKLAEDAVTVTAGTGLSGGGSVTLGNSITINSDGLLSSSAQIASDISGSFTAASASFSTRVTANEVITAKTLVSSSTQINSLINDTIAATIVAEIDNDEIPIAKLAEDAVTVTAGTGLSGGGSVTLGGSITINSDGLLSSSAQIASDISGSFTAVSAALASDIASAGGGTTTNALTVDDTTLQLNSGTTFNGSAARTISIKDGGVDSDALASDISITSVTASRFRGDGRDLTNIPNDLVWDGTVGDGHLQIITCQRFSETGFITEQQNINTSSLEFTDTGLGVAITSPVIYTRDHDAAEITNNINLASIPYIVFSGSNFQMNATLEAVSGANLVKIDLNTLDTDGVITDIKLLAAIKDKLIELKNNSTFNHSQLNYNIQDSYLKTANTGQPHQIALSTFYPADPDNTEVFSFHYFTSESSRRGGGAETTQIFDITTNPNKVYSSLVTDLDTTFSSSLEITGSLTLADGTLVIPGFANVSSSLASVIAGNIGGGIVSGAAQIDSLINDTIAATIVAEIDNDEIPIAKLAEDSISGVALGNNLNNLTVDDATLQLNSGTTYNGSAARTISIKDGGVDSDALADDITVAGDLTVAADIIHSGDTNTKIRFVTDAVRLDAGGQSVFNSSTTGSVLPMVHQNVYDTGSLALNANSAFGDIVKFGGSTTVAGGLYFLNTNGGWTLAQANSISTGASASLAVAVGTNSTTDGMCIRGFVNPFEDPTDAPIGGQVFMSDNANGRITGSAPSDTNDIVRVVGHRYGTDLVYFNPSNDFIVHA